MYLGLITPFNILYDCKSIISLNSWRACMMENEQMWNWWRGTSPGRSLDREKPWFRDKWRTTFKDRTIQTLYFRAKGKPKGIVRWISIEWYVVSLSIGLSSDIIFGFFGTAPENNRHRHIGCHVNYNKLIDRSFLCVTVTSLKNCILENFVPFHRFLANPILHAIRT